MTHQQALNTLTWIEALLSGKYKHGKTFCYNYTEDTYTAIGVAMEAFSLPIRCQEQVGDNWPHYGWYHTMFGGNKSPFVISAVSDVAGNYLGVVALLLDTVPHCSVEIKRRCHAANALMQGQMRNAQLKSR